MTHSLTFIQRLYLLIVIAKKSQSTLAFLILVFIAAVNTGSAQDHSEQIEELFNWTSSSTPGCVCAISQEEEIIFHQAYGLADLEREVPLQNNSVFDAGSVVKQFVAVAALILVEEGKLSLEEDIHNYIPELPDYGEKVTLDHLLTHTSGIRDWTGINNLSPQDNDALTIILRQRDLNFAPGEEWSYSNSGYVLIKEIISRVTDVPFGQFVQTHIFEPLKMRFTQYHHDLNDLIPNRSLAFERYDDEWKYEMLFKNDRGGGGALFSTPGDLLIWNGAIMNNHFGAFVSDKLQEPATLNNGRKLGYGRGLFLDSNYSGKVIWHTGGAAGYKTSLSYFPEKKMSIAIMCNAGDRISPSDLAAQIFRIYHPESNSDQAGKNNPTVDISEAQLNEKQGVYINDEGQIIRLMSRGNKIRIAGGPELIPVENNLFQASEAHLSYMSQADFEISFLSADEFQWKSKEGETMKFTKVKPVTSDVQYLKSLEGTYESEEVGATINISESNGKLVMNLAHTPEQKFEFDQLDKNTFLWRVLKVEFIQDQKPYALKLTTPLVRNVEFTRRSNE